MRDLRAQRMMIALAGGLLLSWSAAAAQELPKAFIDGTTAGWTALGEADFVDVNGDDDTWTFADGMIHCSGLPVGVIRTAKQYTNFELVVEWMHERPAGNSGVFVWASEQALTDLPKGKLPPGGIEVQILDPGYRAQFEQRNPDRKELFFSTHGDVFPVGTSKLTPFEPTSPNGQRSFPTKELTKDHGNWNHYYVRAINGEVRLWVNGEEVSGGNNAEPRSGYLCLESEGSPVKFRNLRVRELP